MEVFLSEFLVIFATEPKDHLPFAIFFVSLTQSSFLAAFEESASLDQLHYFSAVILAVLQQIPSAGLSRSMLYSFIAKWLWFWRPSLPLTTLQ